MQSKLIAIAATLLLSSNCLNAACSAASAAADLDTAAALKQVRSDLEKRVRPSKQTLVTLEEILEKEPNNYKARLALGLCYDSLGLPMQAIEQFEIAVKYGSNDAQTFIELIKLRKKTGSVDTAASLLKLAKEKFPDNLEIICLMGDEYLKKGLIVAAEGAFEEVVRSGKKVYGAKSGLAEIRFRQNYLDLAYKLASQEVEEHPDNSNAYLTLGMILFRKGKFSQSIAPLREALGADQKNAELAGLLARTCHWAGQYDQALEPTILWFGLKANQYNETPQMNVVLLDTLRHVPKSEIRKYLTEKTPKYAEALRNAAFHVSLGDALDQIGMHDLALVQYQTAVRLDPNYGRAAFKLAQSLELYAGDYDNALVYYKKAHSLDPSAPSDYMVRLQNRLPGRSGDLAWWLKDRFRGMFFNYEVVPPPPATLQQ